MPPRLIAELPLHNGHAPIWLMDRMKKLGGAILEVMALSYKIEEILYKFSDPIWFQAFGCLLGFDWHSSGITTTVGGAIQSVLDQGLDKEIGIFAAGGKGGKSRTTPQQISQKEKFINCDPNILITASKYTAKVDSVLVQDNYSLYYHLILFDRNGRWVVIQQGMNPECRMARRYHWKGDKNKDFIDEPHEAICCDKKEKEVLDLTAKSSKDVREAIVELLKSDTKIIEKELKSIVKLALPKRHYLTLMDISISKLATIQEEFYKLHKEEFESLLGIKGVTPKSLRALTLLCELIWGVEPSRLDPARFSFAHGGKDGHPYRVNLRTYDTTISILKEAIERAKKLNDKERILALQRIARFENLILGSKEPSQPIVKSVEKLQLSFDFYEQYKR